MAFPKVAIYNFWSAKFQKEGNFEIAIDNLRMRLSFHNMKCSECEGLILLNLGQFGGVTHPSQPEWRGTRVSR